MVPVYRVRGRAAELVTPANRRPVGRVTGAAIDVWMMPVACRATTTAERDATLTITLT